MDTGRVWLLSLMFTDSVWLTEAASGPHILSGEDLPVLDGEGSSGLLDQPDTVRSQCPEGALTICNVLVPLGQMI